MGMENEFKEIEEMYSEDITVKLHEEDFKKLLHLCGRHGLTIEELVNSFLNDLIWGRQTNGSDERDLAKGWFDRCWFGSFCDMTLLRWLIDEHDDVKGFVSAYRNKNDAMRRLGEAVLHKDDSEYHDTFYDECKDDASDWEETYDDYINDFVKECPSKPKMSYELYKDVHDVIKWYEKYEDILCDF